MHLVLVQCVPPPLVSSISYVINWPVSLGAAISLFPHSLPFAIGVL